MTQGVTEVGCLAHARRKFFDLHASNKSQIAHSALEQIARVYDIEREIKELDPDERRRIRQERSKPLLDALHQWMILNRQKVPDGSATAKALDYSLRRWGHLHAFYPTDSCRLITTISRIRFDQLPSVGTTGFCWFTACGQASGSGDESDSKCQAQWA